MNNTVSRGILICSADNGWVLGSAVDFGADNESSSPAAMVFWMSSIFPSIIGYIDRKVFQVIFLMADCSPGTSNVFCGLLIERLAIQRACHCSLGDTTNEPINNLKWHSENWASLWRPIEFLHFCQLTKFVHIAVDDGTKISMSWSIFLLERYNKMALVNARRPEFIELRCE